MRAWRNCRSGTPIFASPYVLRSNREEEVGPQLAALGIGPRDVKTIVLTHMHIDHDGGLKDFPSSRVIVSAGEFAAASGLAGQLRGCLPQRWPAGFDPEPLEFSNEPFGPFARSRRITADGAVVAVPTPGHTRDHLSVAAEDGGTTIVLAGDASYTEANMLARVVDGVSLSEADARATLNGLRELALQRPVIYLPAHDPFAAERLNRRQTTIPEPRSPGGPFAA